MRTRQGSLAECPATDAPPCPRRAAPRTVIASSVLFMPGTACIYNCLYLLTLGGWPAYCLPIRVRPYFLPTQGADMRPLTLAALTSTALTAVVAHAHVTYASGATLDGSECHPERLRFQWQRVRRTGFSDPITAVFPQLTTATQHLLLPADRQHLRQLSGFRLLVQPFRHYAVPGRCRNPPPSATQHDQGRAGQLQRAAAAGGGCGNSGAMRFRDPVAERGDPRSPRVGEAPHFIGARPTSSRGARRASTTSRWHLSRTLGGHARHVHFRRP